MKIELTDRELYQILKEKFGVASFMLFLNENEKGRERRTGHKLYEDMVCPKTNSIMVGIDEEMTIVPLE